MSFKAKFNLGRIVNKHLILDVLAYAGYQHETVHFLFLSCKRLRKLLIENQYLALSLITKKIVETDDPMILFQKGEIDFI